MLLLHRLPREDLKRDEYALQILWAYAFFKGCPFCGRRVYIRRRRQFADQRRRQLVHPRLPTVFMAVEGVQEEISANVYLVTGCGPEATYVCALVKSGAGMDRTCDSIKEDGVTKTR